MTTRAITESALAEIEAKPKGHVYASRRGIVAGLVRASDGSVIIFRRVGGRVQLEVLPERCRFNGGADGRD